MPMEDRDEATIRVIHGLKKLYKEKLLPLEQLYMYQHFYSHPLSDAEFDAKPQVLMIGQYSTGKTSFIRYLLGRDFPGQNIGPEPTTDRFVCVMNGPDERIIPGNALSVDPNLPYKGLQQFGVAFLNKLEGSQTPSPVLRNITIIDTPGILSGEKQRGQRGYDFQKVSGWFAERCDLILLLFDAHKLDISDEFKKVIESLKGQDDKIRCILNKADSVDRQKLMRVYGALMWSMGKVTKTPEVLRVYSGSFWDQPLQYEDNAKYFEMEEAALMKDLRDLPRNSAIRKINELVKRTRKIKVHACVIGYLYSQMPSISGKQKKQEELTKDLPQVFRAVMKKHNLPAGDFPDLEAFRQKLPELQFSKFPKLNEKLILALEDVQSREIPALMDDLPGELAKGEAITKARKKTGKGKLSECAGRSAAAARAGGGGGDDDRFNEQGFAKPNAVHTNVPGVPVPEGKKQGRNVSPPPAPGRGKGKAAAEENPFGDDDEEEEEGENPFGRASSNADSEASWALAKDQAKWNRAFKEAGAKDGLLSAKLARAALEATKVPKKALRQIWELSDIDKDGSLDADEFAVAMYLCEIVNSGEAVPDELDEDVVPPSKRE